MSVHGVYGRQHMIVPLAPFEESFDAESGRKWLEDNWYVSVWLSVVYLVLIIGGRYVMSCRSEAFELRLPLFIWNISLAIFSIWGALRTTPELMHSLSVHGIVHSACTDTFFKGPTAFWAFAFTTSKAFELIDTAFIVLRRQQLIVLHWYHHVTVLLYCWLSFPSYVSAGRWYMVMNFLVHSLMYSYFALRSMRVRVPRFVNIIVTSLQILQMATGIIVAGVVYGAKTNGFECKQSYSNLAWASAMYISYFVLFVQFFYTTYCTKRVEQQPKSKSFPVQNGVIHGNYAARSNTTDVTKDSMGDRQRTSTTNKHGTNKYD